MKASTSRAVLQAIPPARATCRQFTRCPQTSPRAIPPALVHRPGGSTSPSQNHTRPFFSLADITKLAGLNPSESDSNGVETEGEIQRFHARKILPYTPEQLYSLVSDVPRYSSFIPFCTSSAVLGKPGNGTGTDRQEITNWKHDGKPFDVEAQLNVGFGGLEEKYISRVVGRPYESVTATATQKIPIFKSLLTKWSFAPASPLSPHPSTSDPQSPSPSTRLPNDSSSTDPTQGPTLLTIDMAFSFVNPLHRIASQAVLPKVADKMVEAFERRCVEVWGAGKE